MDPTTFTTFQLTTTTDLNEPIQNIKTASQWFLFHFPDSAKFGAPFLEQRKSTAFETSIVPLVPNIDFLAACLGGDERLGHRVIYYPDDLEFYFLDCRDNMFYPTSPEKLGNYMRGLLARCAADIKGEAQANLFYTFRRDPIIKGIVSRAKGILAADSNFFSSASPNQRVRGPEIHERIARLFCEQILERESNHVLTISEAFRLFNAFAKQKNLPPLERSMFKGLIGSVVQEQYGLGLRNDLISGDTPTQKCGWKGLKAVEIAA